jgi:hypothetical protein
MSNINLSELTTDQKRKAVVAYIASGNSVEALIEQLLSCLHGCEGDQMYDEAFNEISQDQINERKDSPESFENTWEEEVEALIESYDHNLQYSYNSCIIG